MTSFDDLLLVPILLGLSLFIVWKVGQALALKRYVSLGLFFWHTLFCFYYWYFAESNIADSNRYYGNALYGKYNWYPGTSFVESFTALFVSGLGFGKLNAFLVYNLFGTSGLILLAYILINEWPNNQKNFKYIPYLILIMPGLSFWSSAIGKDALSFFAACLATYAFLDIKKRKAFFAIAILVMFVVRPHIAGFMMLAAGITLISGRKVNFTNRIVIIALLIGLGVSSFPFIANYVGIGSEISTETLEKYIETRQGYNMEGGSSVNISSLPFPFKIATFLFRPLFFDASGLFGLVVSAENLFLLFLFLTFFVRGGLLLLHESSVSVRYNLIFFVIIVLALSLTTANLGIAVRQKTMAMPAFFFLICFTANKLRLKSQVRKKLGRSGI